MSLDPELMPTPGVWANYPMTVARRVARNFGPNLKGADIAFIVNPVRQEQVRDIAFGGEVMPQKSTDYYPKMLSGLTIYSLA